MKVRQRLWKPARRVLLRLSGAEAGTVSLKLHLLSLFSGKRKNSQNGKADEMAYVQTILRAQQIDTLVSHHESTMVRIAEIEAKSTSMSSHIVNLEERIANIPADLSARQNAIESDIAINYADLKKQYDLMIVQRDSLLNNRDQLLLALQARGRAGGLSPHGAVLHTANRPFPGEALPGGQLPDIHVIDVGAQSLSNEDHAYQPLVTAGNLRVTGFEPLVDAATRRASSEPYVTMLHNFIGDGESRIFHINKDDTTSSLLPADLTFLNRLESLSEMCSPVKKMKIKTTRLDDVQQISDCDFLKIDVQGGELDVLKGALQTLSRTIVVHTEVEFSPVYKNQPLYGDIDKHLRQLGFELIDFKNAGYATVKGLPRPIARSRLLWAEAIYMKTPRALAALGREKIVKAAVIAHVNYGMYDVASEFLKILDKKNGSSFAVHYGNGMTRI